MARDRKEGYLWKHGSYVHVCRPHWCTFTWHMSTTPSALHNQPPCPQCACVCMCVRKGEEEHKLEEGSSQKTTVFLFLPTCPGVFIPGIYLPRLKTLVICVACISTALLENIQIRLMTSSFLYSYDFYSIFQTIKTQSDACRNEISAATASYQSSG